MVSFVEDRLDSALLGRLSIGDRLSTKSSAAIILLCSCYERDVLASFAYLGSVMGKFNNS